MKSGEIISKRRKEDRTELEFPDNCVPDLKEISEFYVHFTTERTKESGVSTVTRKILEIIYHLPGERRATIGYETETHRGRVHEHNIYDQQVEINPVVLAFLQQNLPPYMCELLPQLQLVEA